MIKKYKIFNEGITQYLKGPSKEEIKKYHVNRFLDGKIRVYDFISLIKKKGSEIPSFDELNNSYKSAKINLEDFITVCYSFGYSDLCREELDDKLSDILKKIIENRGMRFDIQNIKTKLKLSNSFIFNKIKDVNINDKMLLCADLMLISELRKCIENGADVSYKGYKIVYVLNFLVKFNKKAKPLLDYIFSLIGLPDTPKEYIEKYFSGCEFKKIKINDNIYHALVKKDEVLLYSMLPYNNYFVIKSELYYTLFNFYEVTDGIYSGLIDYITKNNLTEWLLYDIKKPVLFRLSDNDKFDIILTEGINQYLKGPTEQEVIDKINDQYDNQEIDTEQYITICIKSGLIDMIDDILNNYDFDREQIFWVLAEAVDEKSIEVVKYILSLDYDFIKDIIQELNIDKRNTSKDIIDVIKKYLKK